VTKKGEESARDEKGPSPTRRITPIKGDRENRGRKGAKAIGKVPFDNSWEGMHQATSKQEDRGGQEKEAVASPTVKPK